MDTDQDNQITKGLDDLHTVLLRAIGGCILGAAFAAYRLRSSTDERMFGAYFFAKAKVFTTLVACELFTYQSLYRRQMGIKFNQRFLYVTVGPTVLLLLGNLLQLFKYRQMGGYIHRSSFLQFGLYVDNFVQLTLSVMHLTYPIQSLKFAASSAITTDSMHIALLRITACLMLFWAFTSYSATGFLYAKDKKAHIQGRLLAHVVWLAVGVHGQFFTHAFSPMNLSFNVVGHIFYSAFFIILLLRFDGYKEK